MANATFIVGNPAEDFFQQNPQVRYFPAVQRLLGDVAKKHEDVDKVAGRILWAVYLTEDPDSKYYSISYDERRKIIAENYLNEPDFEWLDYDYVVKAYPDMCLGLTERWYKKLADKFSQMVDVVSTMDSLDDYKEILLMYDKLEKMFKGLEIVENKMNKERSQRVEVRGTAQPGFFGKR